MSRAAQMIAALLVASLPAVAPLAVAEGDASKGHPREIRSHLVRQGDSLWRIAVQEMGEGYLWPALYRANRDQIQNPSVLYPGQRLTIPEIASEEKAAIRAEAAQLHRQ